MWVVSYFAELCVFATLREQNLSAVFTLRRQDAKFRKGEIKTPPEQPASNEFGQAITHPKDSPSHRRVL
jgi:hypothetical protein